ncbi:hypothetical protein ABI244_05420 [Serratia ureilytica]|uniref:hypothetical protein n=1 Tax=Serratia ureilytica TaxID=300181 RepID=UPI003265B7A3
MTLTNLRMFFYAALIWALGFGLGWGIVNSEWFRLAMAIAAGIAIIGFATHFAMGKTQ